MAVKFLDLTGLQKFWTKCKNAFVAKDSNGNVSLDAGLTVADGIHAQDVIETLGSITAKSGAEIEGNLVLPHGSTVRLWNPDNNKSVAVECNPDGKLVIDDAVVATVADVTSAVANAGHLKREVVSALPGVATAKENVIYMVSNNTTGNNKFDEYMLINGALEKTGSSDVDLSGYSTTTQMNTAISTAINNAHTAITEAEINALT